MTQHDPLSTTLLDDDVDEILREEPPMTNELALREPAIEPELALWGTKDRPEQVQQMLAVADLVKSVVEEKGLYHDFDGKKYWKYEGWSLVGSMLGIHVNVRVPEVFEENERGPISYAVEVVLSRNGVELANARSICSRRENNWKAKPENQLIQMATTRAMGAAYRRALGFIPQMAGFEPEGPPEDDHIEIDPNTGEIVPPPEELARRRRPA